MFVISEESIADWVVKVTRVTIVLRNSLVYGIYRYMTRQFNLSKFTGFEWDEGNSTKNEVSHNVSKEECEESFRNSPRLIQRDVSHSKKEKRYYMFGTTNFGRLLSLVFTLRGNKIRVISARDMNKRKELPIYKQLTK